MYGHGARFGQLVSVAALALGGAPAIAGKPAPPAPPDPCTSPSVVTEATFPAFSFAKQITVKKGPYTIGTFLADVTGKCQRKISEAWPGTRRVNVRYDSDAKRVLIVGDDMLAATAQVSFSPSSGPSVTLLGAPFILLPNGQIEMPADLADAGWTGGGSTSDPRISPDGSQILFHIGYTDPRHSPEWYLNTFWTCELTYGANSIIEPIDPSSCVEVHRSPVNDDDNWGSHAGWGVQPGTIYVLDPWSVDRRQFSLLRLTLPPAASAGLVEIYRNGRVFDMVRTIATTDPDVEGGELVGLLQLGVGGHCTDVIVIDPNDCAGVESCPIVSNQGQVNSRLRSLSWLGDGRLVGSGQSSPNRQNWCIGTGSIDAFPGIDPNGAAPTVLTTGGHAEGAEGGW